MEIRFFEAVYGWSCYGYGEMSVSSFYGRKYGEMKSFPRRDLYVDLFEAMHPRSEEAVILFNGYAHYVKRKWYIDENGVRQVQFDERGSCLEEIFFKDEKILTKLK